MQQVGRGADPSRLPCSSRDVRESHRPNGGRAIAASRFSLLALLSVLVALLSAAAAPANGPNPTLIDNFNRADEDPLSGGGNWQNLGGGPGLALVGQQVWSNPFTKRSYRTTSYVGGVDTTVKTAVVSPGNNDFMELLCCLQDETTTTWDGYIVRFVTRQAPFPDTWRILKVTNGAETELASVQPTVQVANGDSIGMRRVGSLIEGWHFTGGAWVKILEASDPTYTSGKIGIGIGSFNFADGRLDDFGASPLPASARPPLTQSIGTCSGKGAQAIATSVCLDGSDPVNTLTGAFIAQIDDLATPGTGVPLAWSRSYDSSDPIVGRLGPGWTDSYATSLLVQGNGDVILHGDEGQQVYYTKQGDGSFVGAPGSLSTLSSITGGYKLVRQDQVEYLFDSQGRLTSMKDRNAQGLTLAYDAQGRLATITDDAARQVTVSYNASNLVSQVATPAPDTRSVSYTYTSGRLTSVTDVRGKVWTYTYDASGRLATIVDPLNHMQVSNVYGADGRVIEQRDALQKLTTFAWNASAQTATVTDARQKVWTEDYSDNILVSKSDPGNNVTLFAHDGDLNASGVTSPTNETTTMTYDAAGNLLTATAPASLGANVKKTFVYNARNDPTSVTDARNKVTSYGYTPSGNTSSVTQDGVQVASYTYDPQGRVLTSTDGNEKTTTYTYFPTTGYLESVTDPLGNKTTYTYDGAGRVLTRVDPKGNVTGCGCASQYTWTFTYNAAGQQLTETNPLGHVTTDVYDDAGRLTSTTDALTHTTSYTYDDANRVLTETRPDPDGGGPLTAPVTAYTYDNVGNKLTETNPLGKVTTFGYSDANRLVSTTGPDPDGAGPLAAPVTTTSYDPNGNVASTVEPRGNASGANPNDYKTTFTYDAAGRQLTETKPDPDGTGPASAPVTTNTYDAVGNVSSVKDANNHTTAYTYDAAGRILTVTAPDLGVTTYTYDDTGNVLTRKDDNNHITTYSYDDAGRLASELKPDPDGAGSQSAPLTTHTYDANGNKLTTTDPNGNATPAPGDGVTTYGYDRANRQTSIEYSDSTPDVTFTLDAVGNRTQMADGAGSETRTYDNLDRLKTVARASDTFAYAYDAASNVTQRTYPGQTPIDYTYDGLDRLSTVSGGGVTTYAYDIASNLTQTTLVPANGHVETRVYDRIGRLTEVKSEKAGTILARFLSTLDPVGNPTQVVRTGALSETQTYTYDVNDRLTGVCFQAGTCPGSSDPFVRWTYDRVGNRLTGLQPTQSLTYNYNALDQLTSVGAITWTYDQNGNQLSRGPRTFTYDQANRLKTATISPTTTTYSYDGDGVRLQASSGPGASEKTNFLWDVNQSLPQLALERDGANALLRRYTYGLQRLTMVAGATTSYYHYDNLGSVASITGGAGATRWTYSFAPFGAIRSEVQGAGTQPANFMKYTGEYLDPTGLYHLRARQYDPTWSRFMRPDPATAPSSAIPLTAAYAYVANRPTVLVDPTGENFQPADAGQESAAAAASSSEAELPDVETDAEAPAFYGTSPRLSKSQLTNARIVYRLGLKARLSGARARELVAAAFAESGLNARAINRSSGAAGLFQLLSSGYVDRAMQLGGVFNPRANTCAILPDYVGYWRRNPRAIPGAAARDVERSGQGATFYAAPLAWLSRSFAIIYVRRCPG